MAIDTQALLKYLALGAGAVLVPALVVNVDFLQGLMDNAIMSFPLFGGVTVGGVLLASVGVLAVDKLLFKG